MNPNSIDEAIDVPVDETPLETDDIEVEVEDDGQAPREPFNEESIKALEEKDAEDIDKYPRPIKKRFETLTYHVRERERQLEEERKANEALIQYANGARALIERQANERRQLEESLKREAIFAREAQLQAAQNEFRAARESADTDKEVAAAQKLAEITQQRAQLQQYQVPDAFVPPPPPARQVQEPIVPQSTVAWVEKNPWFIEDKNMQSYAVNYSQSLVAGGFVAPESQSYYDAIDAEMRKRFPEKFPSAPMNAQKQSAPSRRPPVATATRTASSSTTNGVRKVVLNSGQVAAAKKLGVPLAEYAKYAHLGGDD